MKQFLLVGIAVLFVGVNASENPFDLKENFGKLDQEQKVLISELKRVAEENVLNKEKILKEETVEVEQKIVKVTTPVEPELVNKMSKPLNLVIEKEAKSSDERLDKIRQNALKASKKEAELQKIKNMEDKKKLERQEVEAYEKKRTEKLMEQKANEAAALEREAVAQKESKAKRIAERKERKEKMMEKEAVAKKEQRRTARKSKIIEVKQPLNKSRTSIDDINLTREKVEAKIAADKIYEEAIQEMNQED